MATSKARQARRRSDSGSTQAPTPRSKPDAPVIDAAGAFPVPAFNAVDAAFGADLKYYLTREQMGEEFYRDRHPMTGVASQLFFNGGKLSDYGLSVRPDLDLAAVMTAIRALLCSFAPKHEVKIGTVGYALSQWCIPVTPVKAA